MYSVFEMLKSQTDFPIFPSAFSAKATGWMQKYMNSPKSHTTFEFPIQQINKAPQL